MAQVAKTGAEKASTTSTAKPETGSVAELRRHATDHTAEIARGTAEMGADAARRGAEAAQRTTDAVSGAQRELMQLSTAGTTEFGRMFVELANEQARQNLETLQALSGAVDWNRFAKAVNWQQVLEIQSAYLRASLERTTRLTRRYAEVSQAVLTSAAATAQHRAKQAA